MRNMVLKIDLIYILPVSIITVTMLLNDNQFKMSSESRRSSILSAEEVAAAFDKELPEDDLDIDEADFVPVSDAKFVVPHIEYTVEKLEKELEECWKIARLYMHHQWREGYEVLKAKQRDGFFFMIGLALNHAALGGLGVNKVSCAYSCKITGYCK